MRKNRPDPGPARRLVLAAAVCLLGGGVAPGPAAQSSANVVNTKHDLSVSGAGPIRSLTETRVCVFCHTPHNATPLSPLWNKELEPQVYQVYTSPTLRAGPLPQPTGPTKLCLSCHDGTIAMGAVLNPAGGIPMAGAGTLPPGSLSDFGLDLTGHHPVSFAYSSSLPNEELVPSPPPDLVFGGTEEVHCITCHDPHNDAYGRFLAKDNRRSALCTTCHQMTGWSGSAHATSTASVETVLPRPPKTWPTWSELDEWGCEACHTPHFAPTAANLLNFTALPPSPFSCTSDGCHTSQPAAPHAVTTPSVEASVGNEIRPAAGRADIAGQIRKLSAHHEDPGIRSSGLRRPGQTSRAVSGVVGCSDCHNPHVAYSRRAEAPYVSGMLEGVSGISRDGADVVAATYEYEVCFKCHGDYSPDVAYVPRYLGSTNTRLVFDPANPSFHPVVGTGRNPSVPSIPSSFEPTMSPSTLIYCTACHADDGGVSRGPHGSSYAPILKERYETADHTGESYESYALCYRCHDRSSILSDASFRKKALPTTPSGGGHSGHLAAGAPCSACHDAHGVYDSGAAGTGSHTHLIDFDSRVVEPRDGAFPIFTDMGAGSGSCNLTCHGKEHNGWSYP
jgi:predicted CXXCH cytochrome family protein